MYSLGIDIGSSSVKVSVLEIETGIIKATSHSPETEMHMLAEKAGYAEQDPEMWWKELCKAVTKVFLYPHINSQEIKCIGITYQMHGLVMVDQSGKVIRPSIIWCDSRAVETGHKMAKEIGEDKCYEKLLNLPGNFTAAKLKWVKDNEPENYSKCSKIMLPGDWIAYKLSGDISTTNTGLSEGIFWDFKDNKTAGFLLDNIGVSDKLIPPLVPVIGMQGKITNEAAAELGLKAGIPITYRSGDQPNNALSLNVLEPGEVAATAGTSGVVYAVTDKFNPEFSKGVNAFAHVNHEVNNTRLGILLCVNGVGIANSWVRKIVGQNLSGYDAMNKEASKIPYGSDGLSFIPFGNGAERMLNNTEPGASLHGINFNIHSNAHIFRAVQEGIAFAFYHGIKMMRKSGVEVRTIKAGKANLFQSPIFTKTLASITNSEVLLYNTDGAAGAARAAALGAGFYKSFKECFANLNLIERIEPDESLINDNREAYYKWENILEHQLKIK